MNEVQAVLRNVVSINAIQDPMEPAKEIYNRCDPEKLYLFYEIRKADDFEGFLTRLAQRAQAKLRGGAPNLAHGAKRLIYDWTHGHLKYYSEPPQRDHANL